MIAILLSSALVLGSIWLLIGSRDPALAGKVRTLQDGQVAEEPGTDATLEVNRATALLKLFAADREAVPVPEDLEFFRRPETVVVPPSADSPRVVALTGRLDGSIVVLEWRAAGGPGKGYRVERLAEDGTVLTTTDLPEGNTTFRDEPVSSISGASIYRVTALAPDGTVAGAEQRKVPWQMDFSVAFLGVTGNGEGRFRVTWSRAGTEISGEFPVETGGIIGSVVPGKDGRPKLDLTTGWRLLHFGAKRTYAEKEVSVPRFLPDGRLERDPDTGQVIYDVRKLPVADIRWGARVRPAGAAGPGRWLFLVTN